MRWRILGPVVAAIAVVGGGLGYRNARADPVERRVTIALPGWPRGAAPVTVALLSDIHIGNVAMDGARLRRIVGQVNAARPDLILLAGDFTAGSARETPTKVAQPLATALARLRAPLGVIAVPGNHDQDSDEGEVERTLRRAGITVLRNAAIARGPLAIGGLDDQPTGHDDIAETARAMAALPGARLLLAHSPDIAPVLPPGIPLLLAGHTHCGQVVLPLVGALATSSQFGSRYVCGLVREGARTTIVTAGLGTSRLPFRFGAPPDFWLIRLGGALR